MVAGASRIRVVQCVSLPETTIKSIRLILPSYMKVPMPAS